LPGSAQGGESTAATIVRCPPGSSCAARRPRSAGA
jgi:hypothetical protein